VETVTLKEEVDNDVASIANSWVTTTQALSSTDVPDPDKLGYSDGKLINATYLYTDILNSSGLVHAAANKEEVASVMSAFLKTSVHIIRSHQGHIRSFDGDRVMGIFTGPSKETRAIVSAMKIKYAVSKLLNPKIHSTFASIKKAGWTLESMTGIATGETLVVRAGIRNNSDLLSVGVIPNLAAKLSDLRNTPHRIAIGAGTYKELEPRAKLANGKDMWTGPSSISVGGGTFAYYTSNFQWTSL
jgi:class 3 adenylate cyclase